MIRLVWVALLVAGCGIKGPPRPPVRGPVEARPATGTSTVSAPAGDR